MIVNKYILLFSIFIFGCGTSKKNLIKKEWYKLDATKELGYKAVKVLLLDKSKGRVNFKLNYKTESINGYYNGYLKGGRIVLEGESYSSRRYTGSSHHETYSQIKNGKRNGISYTLNGGRILTLDEFTNGQNDGVSMWINGKGNLSHFTTYKKDKINGKYFEYYDNGYIKSIHNIKDKRNTGEYLLYYPNGFVKESGKYSNSYISYNEDSTRIYNLPFFNKKNEYIDIKNEYSKEFLDIFFKEFNKRQNDSAFFLLKKEEVIFYDVKGAFTKKYLYDETGNLIEVVFSEKSE